MTEQEAAERLCALLNEIEAAGHAVWWSPDPGAGLQIEGGPFVAEPPCDGEPWEVRP